MKFYHQTVENVTIPLFMSNTSSFAVHKGMPPFPITETVIVSDSIILAYFSSSHETTRTSKKLSCSFTEILI
jgi:hypothetical protein